MEPLVETRIASRAKEIKLDAQDSVGVSIRLISTEQNVRLEETTFSKQAPSSLENTLQAGKISSVEPKEKNREDNSVAIPFSSVMDGKRKYPKTRHRDILPRKLYQGSHVFPSESNLKRSHKGENSSTGHHTPTFEKRHPPSQISRAADCCNVSSRSPNHCENLEERGFGCDQCGKRYTRYYYLKRHQALYNEIETVQCNVCNKVLGDKRSLKKHMLVHSGERPFVCGVCEQSFLQQSNLIRHSRRHTGEKPFVCEICNKGFSQSSDLTRHVRVHTEEKPFVCDLCQKAFSRKSTLEGHRLVHSGQRPFTCEICNKSFSLSSHLRSHERIHTGEKPYECDVCLKRFSQSSTMQRHRRLHQV